MSREHKVTHPVLGPATWREIQAGAAPSKHDGKKVCSWCHVVVPKGRRSRCGSTECDAQIWRAISWGHCSDVALFAAKHTCALCGKAAFEVDHIVPVSLSGTGDPSNLRALCPSCHKVESARLSRLKENYKARTSLQDPIEPRPRRDKKVRTREMVQNLTMELTP